MKFTLAWLKEHLQTDASLDDITKTLTMVGLEVEKVEDPGKKLEPFIIARVVSAEQHPHADRLRVCQVETGDGTMRQVVCGAPNARTGLVGVFAAPGTHIPGTGLDLKVGNIRGVKSQGMLCSERELELSDEHDGIIELSTDAPVGENYAQWASLDDPVIEIGITPNRPDCLGVYGIARDLAAAGLGELKQHNPSPVPGNFDSPIGIALNFEPEDAASCPVFFGKYVRGLKNGASPAWMQKRLRAIGLRPINCLVDITNYVSYDRGRPLHVYDADKVNGTISARMGVTGESFLALDGKQYEVDEHMCVIADDTAVLGLGGIMGGEDAGCSGDTVNVLIESAYFDPYKTAETGRRTGINSDARYRFERGVDPAFVAAGIELAAQVVLDLCGGEVSHTTHAGTQPEQEKLIDFPVSEVKRLSGLDLRTTEIKAVLTLLGFWTTGGGDQLKVAVPSWRPDIGGKADLVEEVVRIIGVDKIDPAPLDRGDHISGPILTRLQFLSRNAKRGLAARGMHEAVTWSFVSKKLAEAFGGGNDELELANPISVEMSHMRPSLLSGLTSAAQRNVDRGISDLALFEVGQIYRGDRPEDQKLAAAGIRKGTAQLSGSGRHWAGNAGEVDVFTAKADAVSLLETLGAPVANAQVSRDAPAWFHPGRSGSIRVGPTILAVFGELHPRLLRALNIDGPIVGFEVILNDLPAPRLKATKTKPVLDISSLQPVRRDFAFLADRETEAQAILRAAKGADKQLIRSVEMFDIYEGAGIEPGKKSVAVEVSMQPTGITLTDEEIEVVSQKIVAAVAKATKAGLRG